MIKRTLNFLVFLICMFSLFALMPASVYAQRWSELGGLDGLAANASITAMHIDTRGNVYVAGDFKNASGHRYVAKWNGSSWNQLGNLSSLGTDTTINALCTDTAGNLYVAGAMKNINGEYFVGKWDGVSWSQLGGATNFRQVDSLSFMGINALCADKYGNVYAAGDFRNENDNYYIAKWNGSQWTQLSDSLTNNGFINTMFADTAGNIFAAGYFGDIWGNYVAKYNGSYWSVLEDNQTLNALDPINTICGGTNGRIYAGGTFTNYPNHRYVAMWRPGIWQELGGNNAFPSSTASYITAICSDPSGNIYAVGTYFPGINGSVAKYSTATNWTSLGDTMPIAPYLGFINRIASDAAGNIYIAGSFSNSNHHCFVCRYAYPVSVSRYDTICQGHSLTVGLHTYSSAGTYRDTLTGQWGQDSTVTLHLAVRPASGSTLMQSICAGTGYSFAGSALTAAGTYYDTLAAVNGCDSIVTLLLSVRPSPSTSISQSICAGDSYSFAGHNFTAGGTYYDTLTAANGCDSVVILHLTVHSTTGASLTRSICTGSSYSFGGHLLTAAGTYYDTLTAVTGCDSIVTLHLSISSVLSSSLSQSICAGSSYTFAGHSLTAAGSYTDTLTAASGCDSVVTLYLSVAPASSSTISRTICAGSSYTFAGHSLTTAGTYTDTLTAATGCDSVVTLQLNVAPASAGTISQVICAGSSYTFAGHSLTAGGTYTDTLTAASGCDSVVTLYLSVTPTASASLSQTLCPGSNYSFGGHILAMAGTYYDTLTASSGCDSIVTLHLSYYTDSVHARFALVQAATPHYWFLVNQSTGTGPLSYVWTWGDGTPPTPGDTPAHTYTAGAGYYTICVTATDSMGCSAQYCDSNAHLYKTDATMVYISVVNSNPLGVENVPVYNPDIYPNPNIGIFTLQTHSCVGMSYKITDITGRLVGNGKVSADEQVVTLDAAPGVYLIFCGSQPPVRIEIMK